MAKARPRPIRGVWLAWPADMDRHPAVMRFRVDAEDPNAEIYFLRALTFAKAYAQHGCMRPAMGTIADHWLDLSAFIRWPGKPDDLRDLWRSCGLVLGEVDRLLLWDEYNGWQIGKYRKDAKRKEIERAAEDRAREKSLRSKGRRHKER